MIEMPEMESKWISLEAEMIDRFGKKTDLQAMLFLIGLDGLGKGSISFTKEEKEDLIHIGICKVLTYSEYYVYMGLDDDGWPHYQLKDIVPVMSLTEQEEFLKAHVIYHFGEIGFLDEV